ncbi:MAG: type II toxin-antitoxin system PemK/MazF family toxin [Patescibacteria group bacterium]
MTPKKGTVVLVPFPFTDLSGAKVRPALVLSDRIRGDDVIVAFISSKSSTMRPNDVMISTSHSAFAKTGLKTESVIKVAKIATLEKSILLGELGAIDRALQKAVEQKLKRVFGIPS